MRHGDGRNIELGVTHEVDGEPQLCRHGLHASKNILDSIQRLNQIDKASLSTISKSAYLPKGSTLKVHFKNETKTILKRILSGILISILLVLAVISCLFYLLTIIKRQKQLAEVKNDLISNITHEFKTPIATISVALESIKNFNVIDDKEKTKTYLEMSNTQLSKLNVMVEKLLETAKTHKHKDGTEHEISKDELSSQKYIIESSLRRRAALDYVMGLL